MTSTATATAAASEPTGRTTRTRDPIWLIIVVVVVVAIGIVFRFAIKSDLWLDEALAVNVAHLPVKEIPHWLRHDGAPPLYYLLLHYWIKAFGTSDLAVRSLSGVFSVATLPLAWACGKRIGGRAMALAAVLVLAASPYALFHATSVRMYSTEIFIVFAGILAVRRAFERPSLDRIALVAVLTSLVIYNQYWGLYLLMAFGAFLIGTIRRSSEHRAAAVRIVVGVAVGVATFVPWLPTFLYQAKHTGTPWGVALLPPTPIGVTFQDFAGGNEHEGWTLIFVMTSLVLIGVFGRAVDGRHIDLDLRTQPTVRWEAAIGGAALVIGTSLSWLDHSAYQSRYASMMFPFFVLVVAQGVTRFADLRVRGGVLALIVAVGFVGGVRNSTTNRTEAGEVAAILRAHAQPGDVVLYCPDQLGPAVHRLVQKGLDEMTYPVLKQPALVDWVDYKAVLGRHTPEAVAQEVLARAVQHTIWYVSAPGYRTHVGTCERLATALGKARTGVVDLPSKTTFFEKPGLQEFPAG